MMGPHASLSGSLTSVVQSGELNPLSKSVGRWANWGRIWSTCFAVEMAGEEAWSMTVENTPTVWTISSSTEGGNFRSALGGPISTAGEGACVVSGVVCSARGEGYCMTSGGD